eukprot:TRINITY_DN7182_c0_g2_i1.p1 TRINITY_DN7182_c0_g2~~TRINITY_DN7182_c0_g2_i1.p1  ORF type:complete len:775 (+),score=166.09 TRINITY_DN7182_c0_g2_i1:190-2514(+)
MTREQPRTLDSDSEDEWVGLPGDVDAEVPNPREVNENKAVEVQRASCGFEILGFQEGEKSSKKRPPKGLADRLSGTRTKKERKTKDPTSEREHRKERKPKRRSSLAKPTETTTTSEIPSSTLDSAGIENAPRPLSPPSALPHDVHEESKDLISLVGMEHVKALKSQRWQHRSEGLKKLEDAVHTLAGVKKDKVITLIFPIISVSIADSVFQVYLSSVNLMKYMLVSYLHDVPSDVLRECCQPIVTNLIMRLGDVNGRVRDVAKDCLLAVARHPRVGVNAVAEQATTGELSNGPDTWKITIGKINLLISLLEEHELAELPTPFGVEAVMGLAVTSFSIVNQKVRKTATSLVVEVYKKIGPKSEKYLNNVPSSILKTLKQEVEIEVCDVDAFKDTEVKEQEEEDMACLEPDMKLTKEQKDDVARWTSLLNTPSIICILSKKWKLRDHVYGRLTASLSSSPVQQSSYQLTRAVFESYVEIAEIGINDAIPQLLVSCVAYLTALLHSYGPIIAAEHLKWHLSNLVIHKLIGHVSGAASVVTQASADLLLLLARHQKIGATFISTIVMQPDYCKSGQNWKMMLARLSILTTLIQEFEFKENSLSTEAIMGYAVGCFQCTNGKVRSAAVGVIIEVYKKCGNIIRVYLREQKPALLNDLKEKIAKVARKDRTKSAPIQTLASIVQPLGSDEPDSIIPCRPSTFPAALEAEDRLPPDSVRNKIQRWKQEQHKEKGAAAGGSGSPLKGGHVHSPAAKKSGLICHSAADIVLPQRTGTSRLVLG